MTVKYRLCLTVATTVLVKHITKIIIYYDNTLKTFVLAFFVQIHPFGQEKVTQKQVLPSFMFQVFWCRLTA